MRRVIIKIVRIDQGTLANQILQISRQINQFVVGVRRAYLIIVPKHRPSVITPRCRNQTGNTSGRICVSEEESMPRRRAITVVDFNKATLCESTLDNTFGFVFGAIKANQWCAAASPYDRLCPSKSLEIEIITDFESLRSFKSGRSLTKIISELFGRDDILMALHHRGLNHRTAYIG